MDNTQKPLITRSKYITLKRVPYRVHRFLKILKFLDGIWLVFTGFFRELVNLDSVTDKFTVKLEGVWASARLVSYLEWLLTFEVVAAIAESRL